MTTYQNSTKNNYVHLRKTFNLKGKKYQAIINGFLGDGRRLTVFKIVGRKQSMIVFQADTIKDRNSKLKEVLEQWKLGLIDKFYINLDY